MAQPLTCLNCAAHRADGDFCPRCGQRNVHGQLRLTELAGDLLEQFLDLRMPWINTMIEQTRRPGLVALDYVEGRRVRYVNPVKYCFIVVAVLFAIVTLMEGGVSDGTPVNIKALLVIPFEVLALRLVMWRAGRSATEIAVLALYLTTQVLLLSQVLFELPITLFHATGPAIDIATFLVGAAIGLYGTAGVQQFFKVPVWYATLAFCAAVAAAMMAIPVAWFSFRI